MFLDLFDKKMLFLIERYEHDTPVQLKIRPALFLQLQLG